MDSSIYRRSLYLFWKRTSPHPTMLTFDAPMRESCTVRRSRTNTPLQALVTLNEPAYLEASRVFAQRLAMQKRTEAQKLTTAFRIALGRNPKPQEAQLLLKAKNRYHALYAKNPGAATELIKIGDSPIPEGLNHVEIASWMLVTSTLMNTDEFLTQH